MIKQNSRILKLLFKLKETCLKWIDFDSFGNSVVIDPLDKRSIFAHYSSSHISIGLIILGTLLDDQQSMKQGLNLLRGLLQRWGEDSKLPDYHNDFNNFAFVVAYDLISKNELLFCNEILVSLKKIILKSDDSNHNTINWLPMRIYVNLFKYQETKNDYYLEKIEKINKLIINATNKDGFIEDRMPKGKSYNLQYNIATIAGLAFLNKRGCNYVINSSLKALLSVVDPEGDINYLGRGANQIFAWGMWVYLLSSCSNDEFLDSALNYLEKKLPQTIENNNIFLNNYMGAEKYLWWDYHFCSVYTGHLFMWLSLSILDSSQVECKKSINTVDKCKNKYHDTGIKVYSKKSVYAVVFSGRKDYLAEHGPIVVNLWHADQGTLYKGSFGPWNGNFGNFHSSSFSVVRNTLGPLCYKRLHAGETIKIASPNISIVDYDCKMLITFFFNKKSSAIFNLPITSNDIIKSGKLKLYADSNLVKLFDCGKIKTQYDYYHLYQTIDLSIKEWTLEIKF